MKKFWKLFERSTDKLGGSDGEEAMLEVLAALEAIDPRLSLYIGNHAEGHDAMFSLEGDLAAGPVLDELIAEMPKLEGWRIIPIVDSGFLFGQRNLDLFPEDDTGNVLFNMAGYGDLLWHPRQIDFSVTFGTQEEAARFGITIQEGVLVGAQVQISRVMTPLHADLVRAETGLAELAKQFGGTVDGWSCNQVSPPKK